METRLQQRTSSTSLRLPISSWVSSSIFVSSARSITPSFPPCIDLVVAGIPFVCWQGSFLAIVAGTDSRYSSSHSATALVVDNSSCTFSAGGPGVDATRAERSRFSAADVFTGQRSLTLRSKRFRGVELHLDRCGFFYVRFGRTFPSFLLLFMPASWPTPRFGMQHWSFNLCADKNELQLRSELL